MRACVRVRARACAHGHVCARGCMRAGILDCARDCVTICVHVACVRTCMRACMRACSCDRVCACVHVVWILRACGTDLLDLVLDAGRVLVHFFKTARISPGRHASPSSIDGDSDMGSAQRGQHSVGHPIDHRIE